MAASTSRRITAAAAALLERRLEQAHQILGLFLDLDIGVADDAESALPLHVVAGEQPARVNSTITCSSAMKRVAPVSAKSGRRMKRSTLRRQADQRVQHLAVALAHQLERDG